MKRASDPRMTRDASSAPQGRGKRPTGDRRSAAPRGDGAGETRRDAPTGEGRKPASRGPGPAPKPARKKGAGHGTRKAAGNNANKNHAAKNAGPARERRGAPVNNSRAAARGSGRGRNEAGPEDRRQSGPRVARPVREQAVREDRPEPRRSEEIGTPPERGTTRRDMAAASAARSGKPEADRKPAPADRSDARPQAGARVDARPRAGARVARAHTDGRGKVGARASKPPASGARPVRVSKTGAGGSTLRAAKAGARAKITARKQGKASERSKVLARSLANPGPSARASRAVTAAQKPAQKPAQRPEAAPSKVRASKPAAREEADDDLDDLDDLDSELDALEGIEHDIDPDAGKPGRADRLRSTEARLLAAADAAQAAEHAASARPARPVKTDASRPPRQRTTPPSPSPTHAPPATPTATATPTPRSSTPDLTSDLGDEFFDARPEPAPTTPPGVQKTVRGFTDGKAPPRREPAKVSPFTKAAKPEKPAKSAKPRVPTGPERLAPARVRLQKVLASAGIAARRKAEDLITGRRVTVNGRIVSELGAKVDPDRDEIKVNGKIVQVEKKVYFVLNKPDGVVCSAEGHKDNEGRPTVLSLLPAVTQRVYPVGRLDFHSRGVLILTNDGDLAAALTHPRHEVAKTYHVKFQGRLDDEALAALGRGITLEDGTVTRPAEEVSVIKETTTNTWAQITIRQGLNRQIRRMGDALGHPVLKLIRVAVGAVTADGLADGEFRPLTPTEVYDLMAAALAK